MKIVIDENIPFAKDIFSDVGEILSASGRNINNQMLKDTDVLLVRSVTKVNKELLSGTSVKFVGTATIGIDHIDTDYLKENDIGFASAPGSNADSVAEYIITSLLVLADKLGFDIAKKTLGIIGVGNVGSRVEKRANILGMKTLLNDPPKKRETNDKKYLTLDKVLADSDIITVHTPLNKNGNDATFHLVNNNFIKKMKDGAILINTSRGKVHDENAIKENISKLSALILDVWEDEPDVDNDLLNHTDIATPHIAGYSFDGKVRGTLMLYNAVTAYFSLNGKNYEESFFTRSKNPLVINIIDNKNPLLKCVTSAYPIMEDDGRLRKILSISENDKKSKYFDDLRKNYPIRKEFFNFSVICDKNTDDKNIEKIKRLGFAVKIEDS